MATLDSGSVFETLRVVREQRARMADAVEKISHIYLTF